MDKKGCCNDAVSNGQKPLQHYHTAQISLYCDETSALLKARILLYYYTRFCKKVLSPVILFKKFQQDKIVLLNCSA